LRVPDKKKISFDDVVFGHIEVDSQDIDDQILLKSDGFPTYQLAVVIDDHLMGVTHVMRGNDWLPSTPKHVLLYEAFAWKMPVHIHLPNLKELGGDKKLSKRFGAVFAREFLDEGYLQEALINFLMFLGWNPGGEKEIYSLEEFVDAFDIHKIHKTDLVAFDRKKLDWYNSQYIMRKTDTELAQILSKYAPKGANSELLGKIAPLVKERMKRLSEFQELAGFFFSEPQPDSTLFSKNGNEYLTKAHSVLSTLEEFTSSNMNEALMSLVKESGFKPSDFFMDLRVAVTGKKITPPLNESMEILGKDVVLQRIQNAVQ
jgi:glutamyl-tRNA synthetase